MRTSSTYLGRAAPFVAILTLSLAPPSRAEDGTACTPVEVQVRPITLLGTVDFKAPPSQVIGAKFCVVIFEDLRVARFSLEFSKPGQKPYTSWQLARVETKLSVERSEASGLDFQRRSANYNEDQMVGLSEDFWVRKYENGTTVASGLVINLDAHRAYSWVVAEDAGGNPVDLTEGKRQQKPPTPVRETSINKSIPL